MYVKMLWLILVLAIGTTMYGESVTEGNNNIITPPDLRVAVELLRTNASNDKYSLKTVASDAMAWNKEERRYKAFSLLQQKLTEHHAKPLVLIEWFLFKTRYESLFITDRFILYVNILKKEFSYTETMFPADPINRLYQQALDLKTSKGNASIDADGANTYFFTIMEEGKIINTFAVFSLSITLNNYNGLTRGYLPGSEEQEFYSKESESAFYKDTIASAMLIVNTFKLIKSKDESVKKR